MKIKDSRGVISPTYKFRTHTLNVIRRDFELELRKYIAEKLDRRLVDSLYMSLAYEMERQFFYEIRRLKIPS
jgi:hypothetical protein